MHTYIHTYIHTHIRTYTHTYMYIHTYINVNVSSQHECINIIYVVFCKTIYNVKAVVLVTHSK